MSHAPKICYVLLHLDSAHRLKACRMNLGKVAQSHNPQPAQHDITPFVSWGRGL